MLESLSILLSRGDANTAKRGANIQRKRRSKKSTKQGAAPDSTTTMQREERYCPLGDLVSAGTAPCRGSLFPKANEIKTLNWPNMRTKRRRDFCSRSLWNLKFAVFIGACTSALWLRHYSACGLSGCMTLSHSSPPSNSAKPIEEESRFPRVLLYSFNENSRLYERLGRDELEDWHTPKRQVAPMGDAAAQRRIRKDDSVTLDQVETEDCKLRYEWQKRSFPTCNLVHEVDTTTPWRSHGKRQQKRYRMVGNGYWRDVWIVNEEYSKERGIFKTMRYKHDYTLRNFDRMRRDAAAMERLTESPFIIDIYSFCGTSSMSEFGDGGDIETALWPSDENQPSRLTQIEKLRIGKQLNPVAFNSYFCSNYTEILTIFFLCCTATQAAIGLATIHNIDSEGEASLAHTDISPNQFIKVGETYKLNDFNRARFLPWSVTNNRICAYRVAANPGKFRSPEEYKFEEQTEMVRQFQAPRFSARRSYRDNTIALTIFSFLAGRCLFFWERTVYSSAGRIPFPYT